MMRSFADNMGFNWPKDIAYVENGKAVTYAQLKAAKSARQARHLSEIMADGPVRQAAYLWVFYQPGLFGFAYAGWWLAIRTLRHDWTFSFRHWEREDDLTTIKVMRQFPCGVLPVKENFEIWKE